MWTWLAHEDIFAAQEAKIREHAANLKKISSRDLKKLTHGGHKNLVDGLNELGLILHLEVDVPVAFMVKGMGGEPDRLQFLLMPRVYTEAETSFVSQVQALFFALGGHYNVAGHSRGGDQVCAPGITTSNANALNESRQIRVHLHASQKPVLHVLLALHGVGWKRLSDYLDRHFPDAQNEQKAMVQQTAKWFWDKFGDQRDPDATVRPEFLMPTMSHLKAYFSVNRFTRVHLDHNDVGLNSQTYFGTTKRGPGFTIPSLAFAVVHPAGGGCGNVLSGQHLLHGSLANESGLRMLVAAFTPPISEKCSQRNYRQVKK